MFGNVRLAFGTILGNFRKSSENRQKPRITAFLTINQQVYIIKRTLHFSSKIWILCSRGKTNISRVRALPLEPKIHIFSPLCNTWYPLFTNTEDRDATLFFVISLELTFKTVLITHYFNPFPISNLIAAGPFREVFNDLITKLIPCGIADQWHSDSLQLVTNLCFETAVLKLKIRIRETPKGDWLRSVLKPRIWWR